MSSSASSSSSSSSKSDCSLSCKVSALFEKEVRLPVRQQVAQVRQTASTWWSQSMFASVAKVASDLPSQPQQLLTAAKQKVRQYSEDLHAQFPFAASLCRSHEVLLLGTTALIVGIPAKRKFVCIIDILLLLTLHSIVHRLAWKVLLLLCLYFRRTCEGRNHDSKQ